METVKKVAITIGLIFFIMLMFFLKHTQFVWIVR